MLFLVGRRVSLRARNISQCDNLDGELEPCSIFIWDGESFQEGKTCKINECSCTKATRRTVDIESPDACTLWNSLDIFIHIHIVPGETHWNLPFIFKHIEAFFHPPCVCVCLKFFKNWIFTLSEETMQRHCHMGQKLAHRLNKRKRICSYGLRLSNYQHTLY